MYITQPLGDCKDERTLPCLHRASVSDSIDSLSRRPSHYDPAGNFGWILAGSETLAGELHFENVLVEPHNLRSDTFQEGVITAIDIVLSLGDQGKIDYDLQWYNSIGSAEVVRSYWVERINDSQASGRCGFVYETGFPSFHLRNHIHIPSDFRPINSPEYARWFWIELGSCD